MKKLILKVLTVVMLMGSTLVMTGCGSDSDSGGSSDKGFVGISMPTKSAERWIADGNNMVTELEALGYKTDLQYGEDKVENQVAQIENMITKGVDILVIASIDGSALTDVLQKAHDEDIVVIAYDRLLMNSEYVDYYSTFDNFGVGVLQATYIEEKLGLKDGAGPFNIELFGGSPDDNNALINFNGVMSVLETYIDNEQLVVPSGQTNFNQIATLRWDGSTAQARMDNLLSANYTDKTLDAVLSPYDPISLGIISSLKGVGYGDADKPLPVITGQDATIAGVKSIIAGEQTQTIFKDTRTLAKNTIKMIEAITAGKEVEVNDTETYDNGVKVVPTYLANPVSVDKENYKKELIDTEYYTEKDLAE
ncbi:MULTISPECIES: multiple monosaccharide ABC transporter substrate-binding protein [unclassified Breznakia]|uniref:multiple monosaccharide ABC transporter substrate-binding protein n=1 Tax=unclassified Breznakia TaxID=2623764 RepID=UPI002473FF71|nr:MULTISPECIES: multiple monosaccharide ABC transporter substrate-binding protein [unclassified Breznakia]MDH6366538.1 putative multiple sugar transport system substrate-binding protein [Breznakia sp. PH1-1]MDH6403631.1 putative multiple sugar transport system substrate-binding protein [Breznakia sp. PF1-11]MDH6411340.1 putative multiple sugar transport system substrate-binding protein [Breznakia sp. PFB1-11]MDH6413684.1 putative multiple sugar transport system substrate-binding protein [Brezn